MAKAEKLKKFVIIPAGGNGTRMGNDFPKQFLLLNETPVIIHTIRKFSSVPGIEKIIIALPEKWLQYFSELKSKFLSGEKNIEIIAGGKTRFHSVQNALALIKGSGLVSIHDAVRPFVSTALIENCFNAAAKKRNAIACVPLKDSIYRNKKSKWIIEDRKKFLLAQTPQCFLVSDIKNAYKQKVRKKWTDDASVLESFGKKINPIEGEYTNIKITTQEDLVLAKGILALQL
ncbi:MAG TPA: 2-C-methyl-D-erythritol 4-phosphate cytidylyltransferase [Bacteroidetes bacterium]|nr:2-C-methyl-D-erythritol 4-phosphate cytidylyltransferase [Bacteroidota bacterium]